MPISRKPVSARRAHAVAAVAAALLLTFATATAPPSNAVPQALPHRPLHHDWHTWRGSEAGFALDLPPTHAVGAAAGIWYVHGFHDGEPTVPDMSIEHRPEATLDGVLAELPDGALVEWATLGAGTDARRITLQAVGMGGAYVTSWYVVPAPEGVYTIHGWEDLYWDLFHHVALTFRLLDPDAARDAE